MGKSLSMMVFIALTVGCSGDSPNVDRPNRKSGGTPISYPPPSLRQLVFSPDSSKLLTVEDANKISLWDVEKRTLLWKGDSKGAQIAQFFADGKRVALALSDGGIAVWDLEKRAYLFLIHGKYGGDEKPARPSLLLAPDERTIITTYRSNGGGLPIKIWSISNKAVEKEFVVEGISERRTIAVTPDGKKLLVVRGAPIGEVIDEIDLERGTVIRSREFPALFDLNGFFPDAKRFTAIDRKNDEIRIVSTEDFEDQVTIGKQQLSSQRWAIPLPDGRKVLSSDGMDLILWNIEPARVLWESSIVPKEQRPRIPDLEIGLLAFSPDGKLIAVFCDYYQRRKNPKEHVPPPFLYLFDAEMGKVVATLMGNDSP